jgi:hypothetical protein
MSSLDFIPGRIGSLSFPSGVTVTTLLIDSNATFGPPPSGRHLRADMCLLIPVSEQEHRRGQSNFGSEFGVQVQLEVRP